jgi:hypothetical protein
MKKKPSLGVIILSITQFIVAAICFAYLIWGCIGFYRTPRDGMSPDSGICLGIAIVSFVYFVFFLSGGILLYRLKSIGRIFSIIGFSLIIFPFSLGLIYYFYFTDAKEQFSKKEEI